MTAELRLLDPLSEDILHILCFRSTNSFRGLPGNLGVSSSTFKRNITFLRRSQLIKSWTFVLNPSILAKNKILFFFLKTNPNEPEIVSKLLNKYNNNKLSSLVGITGTYSLIGQFHYPDPSSFLDSLEELYSIVGETGFQKYLLIEAIETKKYSGFKCKEIKRSLRPDELERLHKVIDLNNQSEFPLSSYQLAKRLNVSQPVISRTLTRWKNEHVILGYSYQTDYWKNHYIHSYIQIKTTLGKYKEIIEYCLLNDRVLDVFRTNSEYSLLIKARFINLEDLNNFLKELYINTKLEDTISSVVLDFLR
jgi:DNA-binding Lrp family transcriptional regulator